MRVLSIGDCVRPGAYTVHSRFHRVVHYACGPHMLFLAVNDIGAGPLTLLLAGRRLPMIGRITVSRDQLILDGRPLLLENVPRYDSSLPRGTRPRRLCRKRLATLRRVVAEESSADSMAFLLRPSERRQRGFEEALRNQLAQGARLVQQGLSGPAHHAALLQGIHQLKGCGRGLTPSGDDFLAGAMAAASAIGPTRTRRKMARAAMGGNPLSNAFLRLAGKGRLCSTHKALIQALMSARSTPLRPLTRRVLEHGATSGADWAAGFILALEAQTEHRNNQMGE